MAGINQAKFIELTMDYVKTQLEPVAKRFVEVLEREFSAVLGEIPSAWYNKAVKEIVVIDFVREGTEIGYEIGWNYDSLWENVRVLVGLYGNQNEGPLRVKPGLATWNRHLKGEKVYNPRKDYMGDMLLPAEFNRNGVNAIENALRIFQPMLDDAMANISSNFPLEDIVMQCII